MVLPKGSSAPGSTQNAFRKTMVGYRTHVQTYGWQELVRDGEMSGTEGQSKRLEGIQISLLNVPYPGSIEYRTHVHMAEHYDVWYRVHAQTFGWMGWAKNDEQAGTAGFSKRLEGIEIQVLPKDAPVPGDTDGAFREQ